MKLRTNEGSSLDKLYRKDALEMFQESLKECIDGQIGRMSKLLADDRTDDPLTPDIESQIETYLNNLLIIKKLLHEEHPENQLQVDSVQYNVVRPWIISKIDELTQKVEEVTVTTVQLGQIVKELAEQGKKTGLFGSFLAHIRNFKYENNR